MATEWRHCDECEKETLHRSTRTGPQARVEWRCQNCRVEYELDVTGGAQ